MRLAWFGEERRMSRMLSLRFDRIRRGLLRRIGMLLRFLVAAETIAHRREDLLREGMVPAGPEPGEQGCGQHFGGHGFVDRRDDGPAAFAGILDESRIGFERRLSCQR